ncbi:alpha/beta-hydrolase [Diplogelasinospora grovesii]|uniref:Alpha/beta-hydrolase n=1 Tax=Diplogelasinospora grovesii TaxID=303347 RepID=A0AAN6N4Y4_9PEZI|nr:alpha/beta-hydrolase [Diplogelasinospora grovesii]
MKLSSSLAIIAAQAAVVAAQNATDMWPLSTDPYFDFTLQETLSMANGGGASTGEVLAAAAKITASDFESYYREFKFLADTIHATGTSSKSPVSRREAFFRSASYYRSADFYLHGNQSDPRIDTLWDSALADFDAAMALLPVPGKRFNVTAKLSNLTMTVPIIFYAPAATTCNQKRPTILAGSGYDGSQEELYHSIGRFVLDRGYNFVTYEGPGQPTVRRQQNLGFGVASDWWDVVTPVVDYLEARRDVDMERLALFGLSFGGLLAPRAASREHRFKAVIANDGMHDFAAALEADLGGAMAVYDAGNKTEFDAIIDGLRFNISLPAQYRWIFDQSLWSFDTVSAYQWLTELKTFNTTQEMFDNITSPVFVARGEDDVGTPGQPEQVAKMLGDKAYYHEFRAKLGAGLHCSMGAEAQVAQVALDWLLGIFENPGKTYPNGTVKG